MSDRGSMPRILVCGWAGAGNIGDELLHRRLLTMLRDRGAVPVVVSRDPEATRVAHGVESVPWGPRGAGIVRRVDGVCVGPGGLFQDSSSLWSMPGNLAVPILGTRLGLPIASVGVGAAPLARRSSGWLLRRALGGAPVVTRDPESSAALRAVGLDAMTGIDLVFGIDAPDTDHRDEVTGRRDEVMVAIGPAVAPGAVRPAATRLQPVPAARIARNVERLADELDCRLVFAEFRGERDRAAAREVASQLAEPPRFLEHDVDAHVEQAASSRLVVASRYHPVVLAARFGTPSIVVSHQEKLRSLVTQVAEGRPGGCIQVSTWDDLPASGAVSESFVPLVPAGLAEVGVVLDALISAAAAR